MSEIPGPSSAIPDAGPAPRASQLAAAIDMMNALPMGLASVAANGHCLNTNDAFVQTIGRSCAGEASIAVIAVPEDQPRLAAAIADAVAGGPPATCRVNLASRPEESVELTIAHAPPEWGFRALVAVRDIREQVKLERQVAQATKMQAVGQLAGGIAHDFNNILTAVLGLCDQLLAARDESDPDYHDLEQIRRNGNRAADLVRQLLAFARQQTLRPQLLDINGVIDGLLPLLARLLGTQIEVRVGPAAALDLVRVDPGQLEQVLVNLAVNARDAMAGGGTLTIAAVPIAAATVPGLGHAIMPIADYVAISVTDTGTGIPTELTAKIFEPFFTTKPVGQGTGLGLSTVYGIVKQTGGFIFVANNPGGGTVFTLYFPVAGRREEAVPPPPDRPVDTPLTQTVLLVEDDHAVRMVVQRALSLHGLTVVPASDGAAALDILATTPVDVLVSDVVMPGMDGVALLAAARDRIPDLPAVLMSGYAEPPQRRAVDRTRVVFLAKPFAVRDLLAAVRAALFDTA